MNDAGAISNNSGSGSGSGLDLDLPQPNASNSGLGSVSGLDLISLQPQPIALNSNLQAINHFIRCGNMLLGDSITYYVDIFYQNNTQKTKKYIFKYNANLPIWYNTSSKFSYYLQSGLTNYPDPDSFATFDLYVLNGLVLPSLKNDTDTSANFSNVTDLTLIQPSITAVTYTKNNINNYFTINFKALLNGKYTFIITANTNSTLNFFTFIITDLNQIVLDNYPITLGTLYSITIKN